LINVLNLTTSWALLPDGFSATDYLPSVEALTASWLACTLPLCHKVIETQSGETKGDDLSTEPSLALQSQGSTATSLQTRAHLLMIMTLALRITSLPSTTPALCDAAMKVISAVDIAALVTSYTDLHKTCEKLTNENAKLKELFRVDAASLNY